MKTNLGLVDYAEKALTGRWGYVWGTYGLVLSEALLQTKIRQYPAEVGAYQTFIRQNYLGKKTADCIGLIKAYMWENNGTITYDPVTDLNVGGMVNRATDKGHILTIPELPGLAVYKPGHIGVYLGDGQVIEAHSTSKGVIQTPLRGAGSTLWTHWLKVPFIAYLDPAAREDELSDWAKDAYLWVKEEGISDGTRPKAPITREEVWTMLYRMKG